MEHVEEKMIYVCCPVCGRLLFKRESFSGVEAMCPKCGAKIKAERQRIYIRISFESKEAV